MSEELIKRIFDPEDKELNITLEERKELGLAFLTNEALARLEETSRLPLSQWPDGLYGLNVLSAGAILNTLWRLASKWPVETKIPGGAYLYVPANDETKAEIYRTCDVSILRRGILRNCTGEDTETIKLGMKDTDDECRYLAYSKVSSLEPQELEAILRGDDLHALGGLYNNRSLFVASLVHRRALMPQMWYSISLHRLHELGTGKWYDRYGRTLFDTELDKVLNRKRGLIRLRKMIFNRAEYPWEKRHPTDIFTDLRRKISKRLRELDKYDSFGRNWASVAKELEKTLPPGDPKELFGEEGREGNFLEDKIDFIGRKLLSFEEQVSVYGRAFIILVSIWLGWKLLMWLLS